MQKAIILDEKVTVYESASQASLEIYELHTGDEISLTQTKGPWVPVVLRDDKKGYVKGSVKAFIIREVALAQNSVNVMQFASQNSPVTLKLNAGDKFTLTGIVNQNDLKWVQIKRSSGEVGFIQQDTKVKKPLNEGSASENIVIGGLICLAGIVITAVSYSAVAQTGGTYVITWGAIVFGAIRFFKGLGQL